MPTGRLDVGETGQPIRALRQEEGISEWYSFLGWTIRLHTSRIDRLSHIPVRYIRLDSLVYLF